MEYWTAQSERGIAGADPSRHTMERTEKLLDEFRRAKDFRLQSGKSEGSPEIVFLEKAIRGLETDLQTLQKSFPVK
ncbi:MAG TPA: hypothetical protein DD433_08835 [Ruminococcaceae bacterium]|nr:hypothetical protein [Oscillospiraceae bacterium]